MSELAAESRGGTVKRGKRKAKQRLGHAADWGLASDADPARDEQDSSLIAQELEIPEYERDLVMALNSNAAVSTIEFYMKPLVSALAAMSIATAHAAPAASAEKNVSAVLVHRAFVDGSGWKDTYDILSNAGYEVLVVQQPTIALHDDVAETERVIAKATSSGDSRRAFLWRNGHHGSRRQSEGS